MAALFPLTSLGISSLVPMFLSVSFFNRSIFRESDFQMSQGIRLGISYLPADIALPVYIYVTDTRIHRCCVAKFEQLHQNTVM